MNKYNRLKRELPIEDLWVDNLDSLPEKINIDIHFEGLYRFAYTMYATFDDDTKKLFEINPKLLNSAIQQNYIDKRFACVHIRYGDKLCYALDEFKQTKYTQHMIMLPVYSPKYYIDQINELLTKDLDEILIMTDSVDLVKKYVMDKFRKNPKIVLFDSHYLDSYYLITQALYVILSYSTFSFSAAYFNPLATCYLLKNYLVDEPKNYIYADGAISPKWIIIDNQQYILNFDQKLLKKMIKDYANCDKYIKPQQTNTLNQNRIINDTNNNKKISNKEVNNDHITKGPLTIKNSNINKRMTVYGTLTYDKMASNNETNVYGTLYGKNGTFKRLTVNGPISISNSKIKRFLANGPVNADNLTISTGSIIGTVYLSDSVITTLELIATVAELVNCQIDRLIIYNKNNYAKKIIIRSSIINTIESTNDCTVNITADTKIKNQIGCTIVIINY